MKILRRIAIALALLLAIVASLVAITYRFPQFLVNTRSATWALQKFAPDLLTPRIPPDFRLSLTSSGWGDFSLSARSGAFCLRVPGAISEACVEKLSIAIGFRHPSLREIEIHSVGPIELQASKIVLDEPAPAEESPTGPSPLTWSDAVELHAIALRVAEIRLSPKTPLPRIRDLTLDRRQLSLDAELSSIETLKLTAQYSISDRRSLQGTAQLDTVTRQPALKGRLLFDFSADLPRNDFKLSGKGSVVGPAPYLKTTQVRGLEIRHAPDGKTTAALDLGAQVLVTKGSPLGRPLDFPTEVSIRGNWDKKGAGQAELTLQGKAPAGSKTRGSARVKFTEGYSPASADASLALDVSSFQSVRKYLAGSDYEIPAPLHVLDGSLSFETRGEWKSGARDVVRAYPLELKTRLSGADQKFIVDGSGRLEIEEKKIPRIYASLTMKEVRLRLPSVDPIQPIPLPIADSRIKEDRISRRSFEELDKKAENPSVELHLDVKNETPLEFLHSIFEPSLKLTFSFREDTKGNELKIQLLPTRLKYLGRVAEIRRFEFSNHSSEEDMKYSGSLGMQRSGYDIRITFSHEAKKTVVSLASQPPLPENDIVSLILFNEITSDLAESDEQRAVEDTQAAMAKKAIGFFSLWALSSTPIESVHFDPSTDIYSAKVKLPGGVTAQIGSDWDRSREFELRKRIGRRWAITAGVKTDDEGSTSQESFLEWFYRY